MLLQGRRTEAVLDGAPQCKCIVEVITRRKLSGHRFTEVRIGFHTHSTRDKQGIRYICFEIHVRADGGAVFINFILGLEPREHLAA